MKTKVTTANIIWQWAISFFLLMILCGVFQILFEEVSDDYRGDRSLLRDLNSGKYGQCVDFYYILNSAGECEDAVYDQYREFVEFYENYMYYIQYTQYQERFDTDKYEEECRQCLDSMHTIAENTAYFENEPHYEYLFTTLE